MSRIRGVVAVVYRKRAPDGETRTETIRRHPEAWTMILADGCDVADRCQDCPLRQCRLEDTRWFRLALTWTRDWLINQEVWCQADTIKVIAGRWRMETRSVYRAVSRMRQEAGWLAPAELAALVPVVRIRPYL